MSIWRGNLQGVRRSFVALVAALAVLLAASGAHAQAGEGGLARVRRAHVLRWAGDIQGGEPYVFEDPTNPGRLIGFEVEIVAALARELGVRDQFVQTDWSNLVPSLERGSFDVILNGLEVTPSRSGRVLFTRPYFTFREQITVRRGDHTAHDLHSLRGLRVGTLSNSMAWDLLQGTGCTVLPYEGVEEPFIDLEQHRTDAVLLDDIITQRYGSLHTALVISNPDVTDGYYAAAVRPAEADLGHAIDQALARIATSGELRQILARWNIDSDRQERVVHWTDAQTHQMVSHTQRSRMDLGHVLLFLQGALVTLLVSFGAMALAVPLGMLLALVRLYGPRWLAGIATAYVEVFRGTPVLLQLYVIYYGLASVYELNAFSAAILGLGLNYGAYEAEVYRAGIQAVARGQMEAAVSLGMSTPLALRRVVMPQAFRLALPSVTNDFIALLKDSSLVSVITVVELTKRMAITAVDTRGWLMPGLLCAALYFAMSYPLSRVAHWLEVRMARTGRPT